MTADISTTAWRYGDFTQSSIEKSETQEFGDWIELRKHGDFKRGAGDKGAIRFLSPAIPGRKGLDCTPPVRHG